MGVAFCGCISQCATWINFRITSCNLIAEWTIVLGKIPIVGLALASSELATTDLPERSHQPGTDFIFPKRSFGKKSVFLHYNEAEDTVFSHTCMKMFKEKKKKTCTNQILLCKFGMNKFTLKSHHIKS